MADNSLMYSADQIAAMPLAQQQSVMSKLSPADQQAVQQAIISKSRQNNKMTMRNSKRQYVACPVTGGNVTQAAYSAGATLSFDMPLVGGGYALGFLINIALTVTPASGSSATYAKTAVGQFGVFSEVDVLYNGSQMKSHPYIESIIYSIMSGQPTGFNYEPWFNNNSSLDAQLNGSCPITVGSGNVWQFKMFIPLNKIARDDVRGVLPLNGIGTRGQIRLVCTPSFLGYDPLQSCLYATGGTGNAVTTTGNINVDLVTINGTNTQTPVNYTLDLTNESTMQTYWGSPLAPLTANLLVKKQLEVLLKHHGCIAVIIDGVQSNAFSTLTNIQQLALTPDATSANALWHIGVADNLSIYNLYQEFRERYKQDIPVGVIPFIDAENSGVQNFGGRHGSQTLNMGVGGFPGANFAVQVGAVSSSNITPRVETFYWSENTDGLKRVGN